MTDFCCDNTGGRVILIIDGKRMRTRGGITIRPIPFERTVDAHDDGTHYVMTKARPAEASFTLSYLCTLPISLSDLMKACRIDVTFDLIDMRIRFLYTQASLLGRPEISSESGEIRGLSVSSSLVKEIKY